jgi:hypothetical protein
MLPRVIAGPAGCFMPSRLQETPVAREPWFAGNQYARVRRFMTLHEARMIFPLKLTPVEAGALFLPISLREHVG